MQITPTMVIITATTYGALIASFCNVVAWRERGGRSWKERIKQLSGRSKCPSCRNTLAWWALVPVASWVVLRGRCARCRAPISPVYPAVEATVAICSGLLAWAVGLNWWLVPGLGLLWFLAPSYARLLFRSDRPTVRS